MTTLTLYTYWRSSAAYRVRIGLALKQLPWTAEVVSLIADGGQHRLPSYRARNPQGLVPALAVGGDGGADDVILSQSMAILEFLQENWPQQGAALLPAEPLARAQVRSLAQLIACEGHPLNNLSVLQYLSGSLGVSETQKTEWYHHWMARVLGAFEEQLAQLHSAAPTQHSGEFCFGHAPTLADCVLIPQLYNARRFNCPLDAYPRIARIDAHCRTLAAFATAAPEAQADAPAAA